MAYTGGYNPNTPYPCLQVELPEPQHFYAAPSSPQPRAVFGYPPPPPSPNTYNSYPPPSSPASYPPPSSANSHPPPPSPAYDSYPRPPPSPAGYNNYNSNRDFQQPAPIPKTQLYDQQAGAQYQYSQCTGKRKVTPTHNN
jgi:hypothetical protein